MNCTRNNGTLYLNGDITVNTLDGQTANACLNTLDHTVHSIDLGGVGRADSACLSLILSLNRRYKRLHNDGKLVICKLPASVSALAELYEIRLWLD